MDLVKLQYFVAVAESDTMHNAAETMNVSQSTVSTAIKNLEQELGVELFTRTGRGLTLTEAGKTLRMEASALLTQAENIRQRMKLFQGQQDYLVRVATEAPDFSAAADSVHRRLDARYRTVQDMVLRSGIKPLLQAGRADFAVTLFDDSDVEIQSVALCQEPLLLVTAPDHPLAGEKSVGFGSLKGQRLVTLPEGYGFRFLCEFFYGRIGTRLTDIHEIRDLGVMTQAVSSGFGVGLMPRSAYRALGPERSRLAAVGIDDSFCAQQVYLTSLRGRTMSQQAQVVYDFFLSFGEFVGSHGCYPAPEAMSDYS